MTESARGKAFRWPPEIILVVVAAAALICGPTLPIRWVFLGSELMIAILYASSLNLLMGYGGMLSFGHSAYYALGAYASGLLLVRLSWSMEAAMLAGPVVAALGALVFGLFIIRGNRGEHSTFLMLTLAFSQLVFAVIYKWYAVTRGDDGVSGIDAQGLLAGPRNYFVFVVAVVAASLYALWRIKTSPFGVTLQAIRDNPQRAEFLGVPIRRYQLGAFVIAGAFGGLAGALYAFFSGTISPQLADWTASARPFLANTIGGVQSFWGPVLGVLALELVDSQTARFTEHSLLAVGALAVLVGVFLPRGVMGLLSDARARWEARRPRRDGAS
ncbi:MAG TPA: branched-chain amino acid ABC transporter permease [Beijerinckiaceae bacterium]